MAIVKKLNIYQQCGSNAPSLSHGGTKHSARAKTLLESWSRTRKAVHSPAAAVAGAEAEAVGKGQMGI